MAETIRFQTLARTISAGAELSDVKPAQAVLALNNAQLFGFKSCLGAIAYG